MRGNKLYNLVIYYFGLFFYYFLEKAYSNSVDADGKPDWKKMRLEAKRLKESRKKKDMNPEIYELSKEAKVIWEELRKDSCPENVRTKLCEELHNLVKGHVKRVRTLTKCIIM